MFTSVSWNPLTRRPVALAAVLLLASVLGGCVSQQTGKSGLLKFTYAADDDVLDFNKPIAVGAKLDLVITAVDGGKAATVQAATSTDPTSLSIVGFSGNKVTVQSNAVGNATINVSARTSAGKDVTDSIDMRTGKALSVKLTTGCGGTGTPLYLTGRNIFVPYDLFGANNTPAIGYGYHPLTIAPAAGLALDATSTAQWAYAYRTGNTPGTVTLSSTLDKNSWALQLVDEGAIDGAKLDMPTNTLVLAGTTAIVYARPTVGGQPLCQADATFAVKTQTTDICEVKAAGQQPTSQSIDGWSFVEVKGLAVGVCKFDVTWQNAKGGAGITQTLQVDVGKVQKP